MKKILLFLFLIFGLNVNLFSQMVFKDSIYKEVQFPNYPPAIFVLRTCEKLGEVVDKKLVEVAFNPHGNTTFLGFDHFGFNGNLRRKISYNWSICYDTLLLTDISYTDDNDNIIETFYFYQDTRIKPNIGSVKIHKYNKNGKKIRREYAPGEKWADLPYDPDSLFFELPKMLKLGDSILRIKHKYPRPK